MPVIAAEPPISTNTTNNMNPFAKGALLMYPPYSLRPCNFPGEAQPDNYFYSNTAVSLQTPLQRLHCSSALS